MPVPKIDFDWAALEAKADELIVAASEAALPGAKKHEIVIDGLAAWIDDRLKWGPGPAGRVAEWSDGRVAKLALVVLSSLIQGRFEGLRAAGRV